MEVLSKSLETQSSAEQTRTLSPEQWLARYGDMLYRHAYVRLGDRATAEDLVQQTFLEAFRARDRYDEKVSEKNWLFTILKHNLIDLLRRKSVTELDDEESEIEESFFDEAGLRKGKWKKRMEPVDWKSPEASLVQDEFWKVFHRCLGKIPEKMARVMLLRELDDIPSREVCVILGISQSNFWILQHRARLALQRCLQTNWFQ